MAREIRKLTIDDYDEILHVWQSSELPIKPNGRDSREMMAAEMARVFCTYLGLFEDSRLAGVVIAQYDGRHGWINRLAVDPAFQRQGIASELIKAGETWLRRYGDELVISALIEDYNEASKACFARHGYRLNETITYWSKRPRADL